MDLPPIIVNLKAYKLGTGKRALVIAKAAQRIYEETGVSIGIAPQFVDLRMVSSEVSIPVFSQHVDPVPTGAYTGHVTTYAIKDAGAVGSLLNHSERPIPKDMIASAVELLRSNGLISVVCAKSPEEGKEISSVKPDAIAVEPPDLIGTGVSVSKARPEIVRESVKIWDRVYMGAGISTAEDVKAAVDAGAYGVLVASAVVKSEDPYKKLAELVSGLG